MSDLYGAPNGIRAAEDDMRQNDLGALRAGQLMGEIAQQPAIKRLRESQADLSEHKVREAQIMEGLASDYAAQGGQAQTTPGRMPSLADPLISMLRIADAKGISPMLTLPLREKAAGVLQREAQTVGAQARTQVQALIAQEKQAERIAQLAQSALEGPTQYKQAIALAMQDPMLKGLGLEQLPQDWARAVPLLRGFVAQGMKVKDVLMLKQKQILDGAHMKLWEAQRGKAGVTSDLASARLDLVKEQTKILKKNGGDGSPLTQEAKRERIAASRAAREAKDVKNFPAMPADPSKLILNQAYTDPMGRKIQYVGKDAGGNRRYALIKDVAKGSVNEETDDDLDIDDEGDE